MTRRNEKGQFIKGDNIIDLTGQRFGMLTVLKMSDKRVGRKTFWDCICDCGNTKTIRSDSLRGKEKKNTISCGCMKKQRLIENAGLTNLHGMTNHPLYTRWNAMIQRCGNPKSHAFNSYGGRGIKVCEEWKDVNAFIEWSEKNGYAENLTIDRIDVNGNYEPSNCRWVPMEVQHYNKRTSVFVEYQGEKLTVMQWAKKLNIPQGVVWSYKSKGIKFTELIEKYKDNTEVR